MTDKINWNQEWRDGRDKCLISGYSNEGLKDLEEFMEQQNIFSHTLAMLYFKPPIGKMSNV